MFEGNVDTIHTQVNKLNLNAKAVRIVPVNDQSMKDPEAALRVEFYICPPCYSTMAPTTTSTSSPSTTESPTTTPSTTESSTTTSTTTPTTTESSTTTSTTTPSTTPASGKAHTYCNTKAFPQYKILNIIIFLPIFNL